MEVYLSVVRNKKNNAGHINDFKIYDTDMIYVRLP